METYKQRGVTPLPREVCSMYTLHCSRNRFGIKDPCGVSPLCYIKRGLNWREGVSNIGLSVQKENIGHQKPIVKYQNIENDGKSVNKKISEEISNIGRNNKYWKKNK